MAQHNVFHGSRGQASYNGIDLINLTDWTCDVTGDTAEATPMGDGVNSDIHRWAQHTKGFVRWTATAAGYITGTGSDAGLLATSDVGYTTAGSDISSRTPLALKLYFTSSVADGYLSGSAHYTGMAFNAASGDNETLNYTFQGTSSLAYLEA